MSILSISRCLITEQFQNFIFKINHNVIIFKDLNPVQKEERKTLLLISGKLEEIQMWIVKWKCKSCGYKAQQQRHTAPIWNSTRSFTIIFPQYSRTSMARTSLGPWKIVREIGSSSQWDLIMAPSQEANAIINAIVFDLQQNNGMLCALIRIASMGRF